jgi:Xaa-Pro dipeptidase
LLKGGTSVDFDLYDTDVTKCEFRQEHFFLYLFGLNEPDCWGALDLDTGDSILFVPETTDDAERWEGTRRPLSYHTERYGVTSTLLNTKVDEELQRRGTKQLYLLFGTNTDSGESTRTKATFTDIEKKYNCDTSKLYPLLEELRVFKSEAEVEVLRLGNLISSQAHVYVMRHIRAGLSELQLEAMFKSWCQFHGGSRHCAYSQSSTGEDAGRFSPRLICDSLLTFALILCSSACICGSGANGSILHYGHAAQPNERILKDGDSCVLDMGAEFAGYATDITRSYPVNGKFTADQAIVHNAVLDAQQSVLQAMRPGVMWPAMHKLAERRIITHLRNVSEMRSSLVCAVMRKCASTQLASLSVFCFSCRRACS